MCTVWRIELIISQSRSTFEIANQSRTIPRLATFLVMPDIPIFFFRRKRTLFFGWRPSSAVGYFHCFSTLDTRWLFQSKLHVEGELFPLRTPCGWRSGWGPIGRLSSPALRQPAANVGTLRDIDEIAASRLVTVPPGGHADAAPQHSSASGGCLFLPPAS